MGEAPLLDPPLASVLEIFWFLRRGTQSDQPIRFTLEDRQTMDPYLLDLLQVADSAFVADQARSQEQRMQRIRTQGNRVVKGR